MEAVTLASNSEGFYVTQYLLQYSGADSMYEYVHAEASNSIVSVKCLIWDWETVLETGNISNLLTVSARSVAQ